MSKPKITKNINYDENGQRAIVIKDGGYTLPGEGSKKRILCILNNPFCIDSEMRKIIYYDHASAMLYGTFHVEDAIVVSKAGSSAILQILLQNGDRELYACNSKEEFEWIRDGLGQSTLDRNPFKL